MVLVVFNHGGEEPLTAFREVCAPHLQRGCHQQVMTRLR
jgi:hypothetical protein